MTNNGNLKIIFSLIFYFVLTCVVYNQDCNRYLEISGPYLGQEPPGMMPKLFAPEIICTDQNEVNSVFTPDGKEFYYSLFDPQIGYKIMVSRETENGWSSPQTASFSGEYSDVDMFITNDGSSMFFISKRPFGGSKKRDQGYQIWSILRSEENWINPYHLGNTINFGKRQLYPTVANNGNIYFNSNVNSIGKGDFFVSKFDGNKYTEPKNLGSPVNTQFDETDPFIAPDESYIIFTSVGKPDGYGNGDLYISFRNKDGSWGPVKNMGQTINTESSEFAPILSPDKKYLFFTSGRRGNDDIYWIDAKIINAYK